MCEVSESCLTDCRMIPQNVPQNGAAFYTRHKDPSRDRAPSVGLVIVVRHCDYDVRVTSLVLAIFISTGNAKVLYKPNTTRTREEDIMVDGNKLNSVLEFTYLGSTISSNGCIDDEIQRMMAKASASFSRLCQRLWNNHHVSIPDKGKIYRAIVLSIVLHGQSRGLDSAQTTGEKAA